MTSPGPNLWNKDKQGGRASLLYFVLFLLRQNSSIICKFALPLLLNDFVRFLSSHLLLLQQNYIPAISGNKSWQALGQTCGIKINRAGRQVYSILCAGKRLLWGSYGFMGRGWEREISTTGNKTSFKFKDSGNMVYLKFSRRIPF